MDTGFLFLKVCLLHLIEYAKAKEKHEAKKEKKCLHFLGLYLLNLKFSKD